MKKKIYCLLLVLCALLLAACNGGGEEAVMQNADFKMIATITEIDEKIAVNVTEAEYAEGPFLIITGEGTTYVDQNGSPIARTDLRVGDEIEIFYGGQVMMSYPPQVVAARIVKK